MSQHTGTSKDFDSCVTAVALALRTQPLQQFGHRGVELAVLAGQGLAQRALDGDIDGGMSSPPAVALSMRMNGVRSAGAVDQGGPLV